jgi:hypothetical protein
LQRRAAADAHAADFSAQFAALAAAVTPQRAVAAETTSLCRGLVAQVDLHPGQVLLSVDWANLLCVTDDPSGAGGNAFGARVLGDWQMLHGALPARLNAFLLDGGISWATRLSAWLLHLRKCSGGVWGGYTQLLPRDMTCLMNYSEAEAAELQDARLRSMAATERQQLRALHDRVLSSTSGELRSLGLAARFEDTLWALCMANSRCFSEVVNGEAVSLMVPCCDMANHAMAPNTEYMYSVKEDCFQLVASQVRLLLCTLPLRVWDGSFLAAPGHGARVPQQGWVFASQAIPAGVEACISYGCVHRNNAELMRDYGFILPGNLNDRIPFATADDVLSQRAAAARPSLHAGRFMAALGIPPAAIGAELTGEWGPEALLAADDSGTLARRRKVVALLSLLPFLRGMPPASAADAGEWREGELQRERASVAALQGQCRGMLASMPTSAESDEALLLLAPGRGGAAGPRLRQAVAARLEIKRAVAAADGALQMYLGGL